MFEIRKPLRMEAVEDAPLENFGFWRRIYLRYWVGRERTFKLTADCVVVFNHVKYIAPKGMVFDGASIPRPVWTIIGSPFTGPQRYPAVFHDAAYKGVLQIINTLVRESSRKKDDKRFRRMLKARSATWIKRFIVYWFVRLGGRWAYKAKPEI